jgi:FkbM family methyltransferase
MTQKYSEAVRGAKRRIVEIGQQDRSVAFNPSNWLDELIVKRWRGMAHLRKVLRLGQPVTLARTLTSDGIVIGVDPEAYIDSLVIQNGYYERDVLEAIINHLPDKGVFWDIGANIGLHSLTVKKLKPEASVIAFEPVPFVATRILWNAMLNNLDVKLYCTALGPADGYSKISIKIGGNSGLSSVIPWEGVKYDTSYFCRVESGDNLVRSGEKCPTVIKVDVEGYELEVLRGMENILNSPECQTVIFESNGNLLLDISQLLEGCGFQVKPLIPKNFNESEHPSPNYIAIRSSN